MKFMIILLAMLGAGAGAFHSWQSRELYVNAALLSEAFNLTSPVKLRVSDYYIKHGVMPSDNAAVDLPPPKSIFGTSVKRVAINRGGVLIVDFEDKIGAKAMTFTPTMSDVSGLLNWNCTSDSIERRVLEVLKPTCRYFPATNESRLMAAIANKDLARVDALLQAGARPDAIVNGNSPLMLAAKIGELSVVERLLVAGAHVDNGSLNSERRTPLMVGITSNHSDVVALLLSQGASVTQKDYRGLTALDHAVATDRRLGGERFVLMLSAQFNPQFAGRQTEPGGKVQTMEQRDIELRALYQDLRQARNTCHTKRIQSLLLSENDLAASETIAGRPLLSHNRKPTCISTLTEYLYGKKSYATALHAHFARQVQQCNVRNIELTMMENPSLSAHYVYLGRSHLTRAISAGCAPFVAMTGRNNTLLDELPDDILVSTIQQSPQSSLVKMVGNLIEAGANVNGRASDGQTPLAVAIALEQPVVAKYLVDAGADVNNPTFNKSFPIIEASKKGYEHLVLELLANGAKLDASDSFGRTALLAAVGRDRQRLVDTLLDAGADPRIRDTNGIDAFLLAESRNLRQIRQLLIASAE